LGGLLNYYYREAAQFDEKLVRLIILALQAPAFQLGAFRAFRKAVLKAARVSGLTWCSMPSASISATRSGMPSERRNATTISCRVLHAAAKSRPLSVKKMAR
jgi:hypothetical protein